VGKELVQLQAAIETAVTSFTNEKAEKRFIGHVTFARIQGIRRQQAEILSKLATRLTDRFFGEWTAGEIELIRSELSSSGARYTTLEAFPLAEIN
jgi:2'-5' RNA ligase